MTLYHNKAARSEDQLKEMERLAKEGKCIFCPENIHEDPQPIEIETDHWMVKKNRYPYKDTKLHLVLIPKKHATTISQLSRAAQKEFLPVAVLCEKKYKLNSYTIGFRSGDKRFNGGSIEHLHAQLVVGDTENPTHEPVRFKMSSRPD